MLLGSIMNARMDLYDHVQPRDQFEINVINALGDISWDEAITAINKHREQSASSAGTERK
jgi:hypothetical protein